MASTAEHEETLTKILGKLLAKVGDEAEKAATLTVTTRLTEIPAVRKASGSGGQAGDGDAAKGQVEAVSEINIVSADITSSLPKDFFEGDKAAFRDYHLKQVALSREIMQTNLKTVADVIASLRGTKA